MATFTYTSPDSYSASSNGPFGRVVIPVSTINAQAKANIPAGATITKVTMSAEFNQKIALGSTKGDVYFYWARSNSATDELERIYTGTEVVKEDGGWQTFSYDITKYFHTSGASIGQVSLANATHLFYEGYTFVVRKWYVQNAKVTWTYSLPCTVTLNANGGTVSPSTVSISSGGTYGTLPTPTRTGYKFNYWTREDGTRIYSSTVVNSSHTLVANWTANKYTITVNAGTGGDVSGGGTYDYGTTITITATPKTGYKFKQWDDGDTSAARTITVSADKTYTATFEATTCTATFKNHDGTVLETKSVSSGSVPTYTGATPTKPSTAQYSYTFSGWSPALSAITSDTTYTAQFTATVRSYTITFKNGDTVLQSSSVAYGDTPKYTGDTPTKASTVEYTYTFSGWSPSIASVTGAATYSAQFTATKRRYTITANAGAGGTVSGGGSYDYGSNVTLTATGNAGYAFKKWSDGNTDNPRTVSVTGNATYTAEFEKLPPEFTSVSMTYLNKQISTSNKVICGEGFIISVGII